MTERERHESRDRETGMRGKEEPRLRGDRQKWKYRGGRGHRGAVLTEIFLWERVERAILRYCLVHMHVRVSTPPTL